MSVRFTIGFSLWKAAWCFARRRPVGPAWAQPKCLEISGKMTATPAITHDISRTATVSERIQRHFIAPGGLGRGSPSTMKEEAAVCPLGAFLQAAATYNMHLVPGKATQITTAPS